MKKTILILLFVLCVLSFTGLAASDSNQLCRFVFHNNAPFSITTTTFQNGSLIPITVDAGISKEISFSCTDRRFPKFYAEVINKKTGNLAKIALPLKSGVERTVFSAAANSSSGGELKSSNLFGVEFVCKKGLKCGQMCKKDYCIWSYNIGYCVPCPK